MRDINGVFKIIKCSCIIIHHIICRKNIISLQIFLKRNNSMSSWLKSIFAKKKNLNIRQIK